MTKDRTKLQSIDVSSLADAADSDEANKKPAKGFYLLPNLFTTAGLFAGFYAIMQSRLGNFEAACLAIYAAMLMDIIDGRLARLTNTQSEFGSQFDSLADMVSFGVAPALIMFEFVLKDLGSFGRIGSLVAFIYIACAALRLARFNVAKTSDKTYFTGVPSPGAAGMIITSIWVCVDYGFDQLELKIVFAILMTLMALAMVSNIQYRSFKDLELRDKIPFVGLIVAVLIFALVYLDPPVAFLAIGSAYMFSGVIIYLLKKSNHDIDKDA